MISLIIFAKLSHHHIFKLSHQKMKIRHIETSSKNFSVAILMAKIYYVFAKKFQKTINSQNRYTLFVEWALEGAENSLKDI
jgi:tRNA threonylcarbamoyladenosine biosynthesis protein TsaB